MEDDLEAIRKKKLLELQQEAASRDDQQMQGEMLRQQQEQFEIQKKAILRRILTEEARSRLGRLRLAQPELVNSVEQQLVLASKNLDQPIDDATLKRLLQRMMPKKKERNIIRK